MTHSFPTRRSSDLVGHGVIKSGDRRHDDVEYALRRRLGDRIGPRNGHLAVQCGVLDPLILACRDDPRSEEHTSELQSLMRSSYAVFCLIKKMKQLLHTLEIS